MDLNGYSRRSEIKRSKPECRRGHSYLPDNLYVTPAGIRVCKKCRQINKRDYEVSQIRGY